LLHTYSVGHIYLFILLVLKACSSLRGASKAMNIVNLLLNIEQPTPVWHTGRLWLIRLGYYKLTRKKEKAKDWIWIIDHTVQLGKEKCLFIVGIRQSSLPDTELYLKYEDVEPIALLPVTQSNGDIVYQQLKETIEITGVPREIVSDHGSDIKSGIDKFCDEFQETCFIYDIKHKGAAILKRELKKDEIWIEFTKLAAQMRRQVQQTSLSNFAPPNQRTKARYMNIDVLVKWGKEKLLFLDNLESQDIPQYDHEQLNEKIGWLKEFREELIEWKDLVNVVKEAESFIKFFGISCDCHIDLNENEFFIAHTDTAKRVREELLLFVEQESLKALPDERLLGSSEILESIFGKLKNLENDQSKSGFTVYLLSVAALVSETKTEVIQKAMENVPTRKIFEWFKEEIGQSLQSKIREVNLFVQNVEQKREQEKAVCFE